MMSKTQNELLSAFGELWNLYPEYRFSQMVSNYAMLTRNGRVEDIYDCEDDELLDRVREAVKNRKDALREPAACAVEAS